MKPGFKSSEWWFVILTTSLTWFNHAFGWGIEADVELIVNGVAAVYALGRSLVKAITGGYSNDEE